MSGHFGDGTLEESQGWAELGMFADAWELIDAMPPAMRTHPEALRVRLVCCTGMGKWELGADLARLLGETANPLALREAAGRFHLAHARHHLQEGGREQAREAIRLLAVCWPEGRIQILDDPGLGGLL